MPILQTGMAEERKREGGHVGVTLARVNSQPRFCKVGKRLVANGFVLVLYLHMKTRKSRGLPLTNSKNGTRSLLERGARGRMAERKQQHRQVASVVLNIQWRHVLNSTCRLATANHMFLQPVHHSVPASPDLLLSCFAFLFFSFFFFNKWQFRRSLIIAR